MNEQRPGIKKVPWELPERESRSHTEDKEYGQHHMSQEWSTRYWKGEDNAAVPLEFSRK